MMTIFLNELKQILRNKVTLVILLVMPVAMITLMGYALQPFLNVEEKGIEKFTILYSNQDEGAAGKEFDRLLRDGGSRYFDLEAQKTGDPESELAAKNLQEAIVVPANFSAELSAGRKAKILHVSTEDDPIKNQVVQAFLESFADGLNNSAAIAGEAALYGAAEADVIAQSAGETDNAPGSLTAIRRIEAPWTEKLGSFQYFSASMLIFFLLTSGMGLGAGVIQERSDKIFSRIQSFPVTHAGYLAGKAAGNLLVGVIQAISVVVLSILLFRVDWGRGYPGLLLVILLVILLSQAISVIASCLLDSTKTLSVVLSVVYWMMSFIGGAFVPVKAFEPIAGFTVNQWAFQSITALMTGESLLKVANSLLALVLSTIVLWTAGILLLRRRTVNE